LSLRAVDGDLGALVDLSEQVRGAGVEDLILDPGTTTLAGDLAAFTQLRRLTLKKGERALGFPIIADVGAPTWQAELVRADQAIAKYAGIIVLDHFVPGALYAMLTLRQNIYTDPQKPIQVQPGVYEINNPKPDSPVMVTTNFSITYFAVANEVEGSGWPAWLVVADAEGMSVLTAWAAGKFDAERIAKSIKGFGIEQKVNHKKVMIPGQVAVLSGELEEELPGWQVLVGPREAVDIGGYLKAMWKN
jgi:acetyl-CoA decarbonylase/synthase complex subunit gamma